MALAAGLSACGGGGDSSPAATSPTPTPTNTGPSAAQKTQVLQQALSFVEIPDNGFKPYDVVTVDTVQAPAVGRLCPNGGAYSLRRAGSLVAPGTVVDFTRSPLALSYAQCRDGDEILNGTVSLSLGSANWASTLTDYQESYASGATITVNGSVAYAISVSTAANVQTATTNPTLGAGTTVRDNAAGLPATFVSGNVQYVVRTDDSTGVTLSKTTTASSFTFRQGDQSYVINGSLTSDEATPSSSSGALEVTTSDGTRVGRVRVTAASLVFEPAN